MKIRTLNYLIEILVSDEKTENFKRPYVGFVLNDLAELIDEIEIDRKNAEKQEATVKSDTDINGEQTKKQNAQEKNSFTRIGLSIQDFDFTMSESVNTQNQLNSKKLNERQRLIKQINRIKNEIADMVISEVDKMYRNRDNLKIEDEKVILYTVYSALSIIALSQGLVSRKEAKRNIDIDEDDVKQVIEFIKKAQMYHERDEFKTRIKNRASKLYPDEIKDVEQENIRIKNIDAIIEKLNLIAKMFPNQQLDDLDSTPNQIKKEIKTLTKRYTNSRLKEYYLQILVERYIPNAKDRKNPLNKLRRELKKQQREIKLIEERISAISETIKNFDIKKEVTAKAKTNVRKLFGKVGKDFSDTTDERKRKGSIISTLISKPQGRRAGGPELRRATGSPRRAKNEKLRRNFVENLREGIEPPIDIQNNPVPRYLIGERTGTSR